MEILYLDSYKKKGENDEDTLDYLNEIKKRIKKDNSLLSNVDFNILQIILKDLYYSEGEHYDETQDYLNELKRRRRFK